jgi:hypothetical protein
MPTTFQYNAGKSDYDIATESNLFKYGTADTKTAGALPGSMPALPLTTKTTPQLFGDAFDWEPKYQHRFIMVCDGIPSHLIKASAKPTIENGEVVLDHINIKRKLKGKSVWNSIAITIYDAIVPSAAQATMQWIRLHHESVTGRDGYSTQYKKNIQLQQLSGLGEVIEEWNLYGCYLQTVNFGTLDWSAEDVVTIEATLNYDYAFLSF